MLERWFPRVVLTAIIALSTGCSGQPSNQLSPAALPIAVKMLDAMNTNNSSLMAGHMERARELHANRVITETDFKILLEVHELTQYNNWNDAKKIVNEAMANAKK